MSFYERENEYIKLLMNKESMTVKELSDALFTSIPTVRRDLIKLEKKGEIIRSYGGARIIRNPADETIPFVLRANEQSTEKIIIAKNAVKYIKDGYTIMLDATTSTCNLIPLLKDFKNLIVITSGARSSYLLGNMNIRNICTGGQMLPKSLSYVGNDTLRTISQYNADIVFFSCRALSNEGYLTDNSIEENIVRRAMMERSKTKIFLCDSKKIGSTCLSNLCHISQIDEIISEKPISPYLLSLMNK